MSYIDFDRGKLVIQLDDEPEVQMLVSALDAAVDQLDALGYSEALLTFADKLCGDLTIAAKDADMESVHR